MSRKLLIITSISTEFVKDAKRRKTQRKKKMRRMKTDGTKSIFRRRTRNSF